MAYNVSFIGTGNMGSVIARSAAKAIDPKRIYVTDCSKEKAESLASEISCNMVPTNEEALEKGDYIFLCVKPQVMKSVVSSLGSFLKNSLEKGEKKVLVSIAAGIKTETFKNQLASCGSLLRIIRIMPNLPAFVAKGMTAVCAGSEVEEASIEDVLEILSGTGLVEVIDENLMDQFGTLASCSPAFAALFIEAMEDAGVKIGLTRIQARKYASQSLLGSAVWILENGKQPSDLKNAVCSPGGSSIAGVAVLEEQGFRSALIKAVESSYEKNAELGKN